MPDVWELIMQDHREVERLFEELRTQPDRRAGSVPVLVTLLTAHSRAEEAEVYPVARDEADAADKVTHSQREHAEADEILEQLAAADPQSAEFEETLAKLVEAVTHHVDAGLTAQAGSGVSAPERRPVRPGGMPLWRGAC